MTLIRKLIIIVRKAWAILTDDAKTTKVAQVTARIELGWWLISFLSYMILLCHQLRVVRVTVSRYLLSFRHDTFFPHFCTTRQASFLHVKPKWPQAKIEETSEWRYRMFEKLSFFSNKTKLLTAASFNYGIFVFLNGSFIRKWRKYLVGIRRGVMGGKKSVRGSRKEKIFYARTR